MTKNIFEGENGKYEDMALRLGEHVNFYQPSGWREPIHSVMPNFSFSAEEVKGMEIDFSQGNLKERLGSKYKNFNVVDAIYDFFDKSTASPEESN